MPIAFSNEVLRIVEFRRVVSYVPMVSQMDLEGFKSVIYQTYLSEGFVGAFGCRAAQAQGCVY